MVTVAAAASSPTVTSAYGRAPKSWTATVARTLPDGGVQVMLDANDPGAPVGTLFVVDSVQAFHAGRHETLAVVEEPAEVPGGFLATYQDPGGATLHVMDQSTDTAPA